MNEATKIRQLAKDYEKRGYEVLIEPYGNQLPDFMKNYRPDMIVRKGDEHLVVEVKMDNSSAKKDQIMQYADLLKEHDGWDLELIVLKPRQTVTYDIPIEKETSSIITWREIDQKTVQAASLLEKGYDEAAILIAWIAIEGAARQLAFSEKIRTEGKPTAQIVKSLVTYGLITNTKYNQMMKWMDLRNTIIHGIQHPQIGNKMLRRMLDVIRLLKTEAGTNSQLVNH